jgi:hypothetical protein
MSPKHLLQLLAVLFYSLIANAQKIDETYNQKIEEFTTDPKFLPASVLDVVGHPTIPSPLKYFGQIVGAPDVMHRTTEIYNYYQKLSEVSPFLKIQQVSAAEEGRAINLVLIGNEEVIKRIDHYKKQLALLADPRKITGMDINQIINDSKPVFYLNGRLHSTEMGLPEMLMELAYRLITSNSDDIKKIRDNVIVIINPDSEPDGSDKQVDWYYR